MKRFLALIMAGVMLFATPVMAADDDWDDGWEEEEGSRSPSASTVKPKPSKPKPSRPSRPRPERPAPPPAPAPPVEASSVPSSVVQAAAAEGKTVGEYMNNAVVTVPGLDYALPIGQGGHVILNGAPSNQVFSVLKPLLVNVNSAKTAAAVLGGRVLTVVRVNASVSGFQTARVNFYMKGARAGQNIKVFQAFNGDWLEVDVVEIRADHVVVDMTGLGTLAFIEVPNW